MASTGKTADWIAVDWGTSNLRVWAMSGTGDVLDEASSADGMGGLDRARFEPALLSLISGWLADGRVTPVLACGMVGSRQGWAEAPYRAVPCKPAEAIPTRVAADAPRIAMFILPGIRQDSPADVMRGEETQVQGALALRPNFDGILCLPGTHTKWIHVSADEVVSFQTAMTGELFALLSKQSVLRHSMGTDAPDMAAFDQAVSDALSRPERLAQRLFSIRAEGLLHDQGPAIAAGRLSGLLIGAELAAARPYWLGQPVLIGGAPKLAALYGRALDAQGVTTSTFHADELTLAGLRQAHLNLPELTA